MGDVMSFALHDDRYTVLLNGEEEGDISPATSGEWVLRLSWGAHLYPTLEAAMRDVASTFGLNSPTVAAWIASDRG